MQWPSWEIGRALGIPVVYALMLAPGHPTAATVVTAASESDLEVSRAIAELEKKGWLLPRSPRLREMLSS